MRYPKFFLTAGTGDSGTSDLNAFDKALLEAGVSQCNLVPVSSILPEDAVETKPADITPGTITHCVLASKPGKAGKQTTAGIGYCFLRDRTGKKSYGIVAEDSGHYDAAACERNLRRKLAEMADAREMKTDEGTLKTRTATTGNQPGGRYSHAIAALIYTD